MAKTEGIQMRISRRGVLARMGLLVAASEVLPRLTRGAAPAGASSASSKATELIHDALIWDDHSGFDPVTNYDLEHLEDWRQAGVDYLSIDVGYDVIDWERAIKNLGAYITWLEKRPDKFLLVRRADDVLEAKKTRRMAITFDLEGMNALNGDPSLVALYYRLGVRQMLTAYNKNNLAGGGCHDKDTGLTAYGRRVIAEMNRVGMLVDCSHTGYRTSDFDHPDFWPPAEYAPPWPMKDASPGVFAQLAQLLIERGWSSGDVRKVLGGNFLRVARAVWK
jgi:microsomal dipeptidase-like Zn-dependent dipeptidase